MKARLFVCMLRLFFSQEFGKFVHKRINVFELPVNGGEAHIGHLVNVFQFFHNQLADVNGRHFPVEGILKGKPTSMRFLADSSRIRAVFRRRAKIIVEQTCSCQRPHGLVFDNNNRNADNLQVVNLGATDAFPRRRIPSSVGLESITLFSSNPQNGHFIFSTSRELFRQLYH